MNELRRMAYLDALGVDAYVSRQQLPGAAATRRLAIVRPRVAKPVLQPPTREQAQAAPSSPGRPGDLVRKTREVVVSAPGPEQAVPGSGSQVIRFSLSAIVAGDWLWLEELDGMPLAVEQVHLVDAMARALRRAPGRSGVPRLAAVKPDVTQFDWPIHTNRQLALDEEAALAAVTGFVSRRLEQFGCAGLVLLGESCSRRVLVGAIGVPAVRTASTAEMLARPGLKPQVWRDLQPLFRAP